MATKKRSIAHETGSGNVFADLGFENAAQELLKAHLTLQIHKIVKERDLSQAQAAALLGIKQPHVSLLMRSRPGTFSVERLMEFLNLLGLDVEVRLKRTRGRPGRMLVVAASA